MITDKTKSVYLSCLAKELSDTIIDNLTVVYPKVKAEIGVKLLEFEPSLLKGMRAELEQGIYSAWTWDNPAKTLCIPSYTLCINADLSYSLVTDDTDCIDFNCIEGSEGGLAYIWFTYDEVNSLWGDNNDKKAS